LQEFVLNIINNFGYLGVFLLVTIENIFPPIPSELILTFSGFMTISSNMSILGVIISATLGSVLGAIILYIVGMALDNERLKNLLNSRLAGLLHLKRADVNKTGNWFERYSYKAVFICRFVPIVRSLISIPAGMSKMKIWKFLLLTTLGTFLWNAVLVCLGRLAGEAWEKVVYYFDVYTTISIVIMVSVAIVLGAVFIKRKLPGRADR
jgi:Uncharacterized membrane-associated protein